MGVKVIDSEATCLNIKRLMEERNLTPKDIQEALRLDSVQAVYKWLNPRVKSMPSLDNLVQLANYFGCNIEDILVLNEIGM